MRIITLLIAGTLVACCTAPTLAARKPAATPTFASCESLAMQRGVQLSERHAGTWSEWHQFMIACMAGKIAGAAVVAQAHAPENWSNWNSCEALLVQRGVLPTERRSGEEHEYGQFMQACLRGEMH